MSQYNRPMPDDERNSLKASPQEAAIEKAEKVIESESVTVLSRHESLRLLEPIENQHPLNKKFLQSQARYLGKMNDAISKAN